MENKMENKRITAIRKDYILETILKNKEEYILYIRTKTGIVKAKIEATLKNIVVISVSKREIEKLNKGYVYIYFNFQNKTVNFECSILMIKPELNKVLSMKDKKDKSINISEKYLYNNNLNLVVVTNPDFILVDLKRIYERIATPEGLNVFLRVQRKITYEDLQFNDVNLEDINIENSSNLFSVLDELESFLKKENFKYDLSFIKDTKSEKFDILERISILLRKPLYTPVRETEDTGLILSLKDMNEFLRSQSSSVGYENRSVTLESIKAHGDSLLSLGFKNRLFMPIFYGKLFLGVLKVFNSIENFSFLEYQIETLLDYTKDISRSYLLEFKLGEFIDIKSIKLKNLSASGALIICRNRIKYYISNAKNISISFVFKDKSLFKFNNCNIVWEKEDFKKGSSLIAIKFDKKEDDNDPFIKKLYGQDFNGILDRISIEPNNS